MSRHLPADLIDEVRERTDIVEIVSRYVRLARSGRRLRGLCPFHSEKTPSFYVDPEKQLFHCFGCRAGGNVFHFLMRIEHAPFGEVVRRLADELGIPVESVRTPEEERRLQEIRELQRALEIAARFYSQLLFADEGRSARAYLKSRGLNAHVVRAFGLGYAPDEWHRLHHHLLDQGVSEEVAIQAGLLGRGERGAYDWLRNRIVFPIVNVRGRVVGFGGRLLSGDGPKYLNSAESPVFSKRRQLYGLQLAKQHAAQSGRIVVVEGYMDVVALHRHGFGAAVATLGTALAKEQALLLKRIVPEVVLAYDADAAGRAATLRGLELLEGEGLRVKVATLPEGHDPDSLVREEGLGAFLELIEASLPLVEYKMNEALRGADLNTVQGRMEATERLLPILASVSNPVGREGYIVQLAARLGVSVRSLQQAFEEYLAKRETPPGAPGGGERLRHNLSRGRYTNKDLGAGKVFVRRRGPQGRDLFADPASWRERDLLRCLLEDPSKAGFVRGNLGDEPFSSAEYNKLFQWILAQGELAVTGESLLGRIDDPKLAELAGALLLGRESPPGPFEAYLEAVKEMSFRRQIAALEVKLTELMQQGVPNPAELVGLVEVYKDLRDRLRLPVNQRDPA
ncbi:MAG TPA: DNA primase [Limnochordia bacterium]|nr:DNA primase [Limnochordia bacterium]